MMGIFSINTYKNHIKVIQGVYPGVTTSELDELAAQTSAYMATQHPDFSQLAARISVSNLHKQTEKASLPVVLYFQPLYFFFKCCLKDLVPSFVCDLVYKTRMASKGFKMTCWSHLHFISSSPMP